jgi:four helix bundle protein
MSTYKRFEDLPCWQHARKFAAKANAVIENSKIKHSFKLRDQMLGSSGSVMDNIAEGFDRNSNAELVRFLFIAKGSAAEFKSQSYRALDAEWIDQESFEQLSKMAQDLCEEIATFIKYLQKSELKGSRYAKN